jgi:hypothetical protein
MMLGFFAFTLPTALIGVALIRWARPMSRVYNEWTTKQRAKSNTSPSKEEAHRNERIMAGLFRICGAAFIAIALWAFVQWFDSR